MRKIIIESIKQYIRSELINVRKTQNLTQAQMAEKLEISERAYTSLESGKSCCNIITFILFLTFCVKDKENFINTICKICEDIQEDVA